MNNQRRLSTAPEINIAELKHKKPNRTIPVHTEFHRDIHKRECDRILQDVWVRTGCVVLAYWNHYTIINFDVFGGARVEQAVGMLNDWIAKGNEKTKESSAWAKLPAYNENDWYYGAVRQMEDARKEMYKTDAPEGDFKEFVDWPEALRNQQITPRDAFGSKLVALDAIRTRDEVFITLLPGQDGYGQIEIQSSDEIRIQAAKQHVINMVNKVRVKQLGATQSHNMVLDETEGIDVELVEAEYWWPNLSNKVVPRLLPSGIMFKPGSYRQEVLHPQQLFPVEQAIGAALNAVRFDRGSFEFTIRLGCLALDSKHMSNNEIGKTYPNEWFLKSIQGRVECDVKKWLVDCDVGEHILSRFMIADDFLEPLKSADCTPSTLAGTCPTFRVTWAFMDPNTSIPKQQPPARHSGRPAPLNHATRDFQPVAPHISLIIVQVDWTRDEYGAYEKSQPRYYKLTPGNLGAKMNMDINLLELGESRAWHFGLESMIPMPKKTVPPILKSFAMGASLKRNYDISSRESFAQWDNSPTVLRHLTYARSDKIYSFGIRNTCYKVDLMAMWYPGRKEPCWGIAVTHVEWAFHLAELENLPVGRSAEWDDIIAMFLPDDGLMSSKIQEGDEELGIENLSLDAESKPHARHGIRILADKLLTISELVHSATAPQGGVSI